MGWTKGRSVRQLAAAWLLMCAALTGGQASTVNAQTGGPLRQATSVPGHTAAAATGTRLPHVSIPDLDISRPIHDWGCRGGTIPNLVWSWDCSGHNNLYLLGHAWGVFKPLHDAFARGDLTPGLRLSLRSPNGSVSTFRLAWVRRVRWQDLGTDMWGPGRTWAWNATKHPVVTLQTCFGRHSQWRIIVRFRQTRPKTSQHTAERQTARGSRPQPL